MDKREILTALEQGRLTEVVESLDTTTELNDVHNALFHKALELGVPRTDLIRSIDGANYDIARSSLLDYRDLKQMSRKMLEDYDPRLALKVFRGQINVMIKACEVARKQRVIFRPEEKLFNEEAYGQTLATAAPDGTPEVAVFTGLAKLSGDKVTFGRIGAEKAYQNLKQNPRGVFTAVGPSNDPSRYDFVTIAVELVEDHTDGSVLEELRHKIGPAVTNAMVFSVSGTNILHLPKPAAAR